MNDAPIGIFDSGVGGLSVWQEIASLLPNESMVYVGDSAHAPYGRLSVDEIYDLSKKITQFLLTHKIKLLVIACNTATVSVLERIRSDFRNLPVIGTVPVIKTAVEVTKNDNIGVLATVRTSVSHYHKHLLEEFGSSKNVITVGTNSLVPFIERGEVNTTEFKELLRQELEPFVEANVDTIVLGSTHFAFIQDPLRELFGENVRLLHSGGPVARQVKRVLENNTDIASSQGATHTFFTTGDVTVFETTVKKLAKESVRDKIGEINKLII